VDRLRLGLALLAFAPLAWIAGELATGAALDLQFLGLVLVLAGAAVLAWALPGDRAALAIVGFAVAGCGMLLFYDGIVWRSLSSLAGGVFVLGCVAGAVGVRRPSLLAVGLFAIALAGALWVVSDGMEGASGLPWQPGNLLALAGGLVGGLAALRGPATG
jgi:hypothetical protein